MGNRTKIVNLPSNKNKKTDWHRLWSNAKITFEMAGMSRHQAVLENFKDQKEEICRIFNIVSEADLARVKRQIEKGK